MAEKLEEEDVNTQEAFETLLNQLHEALRETQEQGEQAFQEGRFDDAQATARHGEEIKTQIEQLETLYDRWPTLVQHDEPSTPRTTRIPRGKSTPGKAYWIPILRVLEQMGGSAKASEVAHRVKIIMEDQFVEADFEQLPSDGMPRWKKNTHWARQHLKEEGFIAPDSPRGVWEITEAGRRYLREHRKMSANPRERNHESTG